MWSLTSMGRGFILQKGVNKTTSENGLPLNWSVGYLNQWLAVILPTKDLKLIYELPLTIIKTL
jgi:hypothetical protein